MPDSGIGLQRVLEDPRTYDLLQRVVGARRAHDRFVREHVRPVPGARVLDLGCGPGHVLSALPPDIRYVGIDASPRYVEAGRRIWQGRGEFRCADVSDVEVSAASFDVVMAVGLLHHLDDDTCTSVFRLAARALTGGGRFVSLDGTYAPGQPRAARWLLDRDRGEYVRPPDRYAALARPWFGQVAVSVRSDLLRVPHSLAALECSEPRAA